MRITTKVAGAMLWTAALFTASTLLAQEELPSPPPVVKPATPATTAPKAAAPKSTAPKTAAPKTTARRATSPNAAAPNAATPRPIGPPVPFPPGPPPIAIGPFAPPPILSMRRDLPPDVRARRERLRALSAQALDAFLPPDGSGPVGPDGARFGAAAAAILGDGLIETLTVKLDPAGTNLKEDKVKFDTVATMRRSPWAPEPSKLSSQMNVKIGPNEAGAAAAAIDGKLRFQTQTVPLVNYALA